MSYDANDALNEIEEALSELERVAEDASLVKSLMGSLLLQWCMPLARGLKQTVKIPVVEFITR
ncbi:hypothetical protein P2J14_14165 [Mannheimia haemolytica]|nr:hypothetical protein [Mannheimia haemolytica]MDW0862706.1 hypothetical protein [Mannheimia haemolytica]